MLGLSKSTDYALLSLTMLARAEPGRSVRTREIAEQHNIPVELLAKVLQRLTKAALLTSTPGPTGGYLLSRPAHSISVAEVLVAVEGNPALMQCMRPDHNCDQRLKCTIRTPLEKINHMVFDLLDRVSIADIAHPEPPAAAPIDHSRILAGIPAPKR
jgi:Rrf2 family protein